MRIATVLFFWLSWVAPARAVDVPEWMVLACTPDAIRLCAAAIPDKIKVAKCLARQVKDLNPACRKVFENK